MKAIIVPPFIATLFIVCSAFPLYEKVARIQQSSNFCATLVYDASYVHLCYTPQEGSYYITFLYAHTHVFSGLVYSRFTSRICMQSYCSFFPTTIAGTCIMANLPRCLPSTMQSATPMNVTLPNGQHQVLFSATSCDPGKLYSWPSSIDARWYHLPLNIRRGEGGAIVPKTLARLGITILACCCFCLFDCFS